MFDVVSVSKSYQLAIQLEKQLMHISIGGVSFGSSRSSSSSRCTLVSLPSSSKPTVPPPIVAPTFGFCCFNCGEQGHLFMVQDRTTEGAVRGVR